jgi:hypothetical protein
MAQGDYVRQADPRRNYWFDFAESEILRRRKHYPGFALVLVDDRSEPRNGFCIPFSAVTEMFDEAHLSKTRDGRRRWTGKVLGGRLRVDNCPLRIDVRKFQLLLPCAQPVSC